MPHAPDVDHLGVVVGPQVGSRIIALGTSSVFLEDSLVRSFLSTEAALLDNGVQAHLYTRPGDTLVVRVPERAEDAGRRLRLALEVNGSIWRGLTGIELGATGGGLVLAGMGGECDAIASGTRWVPGGMLDAAVTAAREGRGAILAFVLTESLLDRLGVDASVDADLVGRARAVSFLMDKNRAIPLLASHGVPTARTHTFDHGARDDLESVLAADLPRRKYVFKPAGGAAGAGVFTRDGRGAEPAELAAHVEDLRRRALLPLRFQVQEHLPGPTIGAVMLVDGRGGCRVLETHRQRFDGTGRFAGARWTRSDHAAREGLVGRIGSAISSAVGVPLLLGVDLVDDRVIEVNPRVTASAPIAHLLRQAPVLRDALGGRDVEQIDLHTRAPIPFAAVADGRLRAAVEQVRTQLGALVLPQGVDPFGPTRVVIVNDDRAATAWSTFVRLVA